MKRLLGEYVEKKKIRKVLQRIQDFTGDQARISQDNAKNVVKALFNISDDLPEEKSWMWDFGIDMDLMRIIYQLLKRETDKNKNFEILKKLFRRQRLVWSSAESFLGIIKERKRAKILMNL